jgi:hypothetical protein
MTKYHYSAKRAQTVQKKKAKKAQKDITVYRFRESRDGEAEEVKRSGGEGCVKWEQ